MASKGTGGGLVSANTHGPTKFAGPGSMSVKIEGKSVHLLGEPMLNNCGPSGSPPNSATMTGEVQAPKMVAGQCTHPEIRREPPLGSEQRTTAELAQSLEDEADRLDKLAEQKTRDAVLESDKAQRSKLLEAAASTRDGAKDKRFEATVARDTKAKEVSVKVFCVVCEEMLAEFDVVTAKGTYKEVKESGKAVKVSQLYKEIKLAQDSRVAPAGTVVHLAVPGDGKQRAHALNRFVRPGGRKMTNKGAGYNHLIQEH
jgi:hypothetical protein